MNFDAVVFDLDGTLLNTLVDIGNSTNIVLEEHGLPTHEIARYKEFVGNGVGILFRRAIPETSQTPDLIAECCDGFKRVYAEHWNDQTTIYDGIGELLSSLTNAGVKIGVLSNKPHEATLVCVREFLVDWSFDAARGQLDPIPPKPDPGGALEIAKTFGLPPERCAYVGDTNVDMQTGTRAGMYAVGVSWGFRPVEELWENGAKKVIDHPSELLPIVGV
ncbi:MAG: HAD family hydrolase [Planctomycetaceae bacterium]|nr:HAD family hydrolase [Planctomycetaceae bacterium]